MMEITEQYMSRCVEDFSESCRDFLRHSLEDLFQNYEAFVSDKIVLARQQYRDLMEAMVHDSKQEESLDSLLSDPKQSGTGMSMSDATIEYKEETATTEDEDVDAEAAELRLLSMYRPVSDHTPRSFLSEAVHAHPLGELSDSLSALHEPDSPVEVSCDLVAAPRESDECDLDATKDDDDKSLLCCFKVASDDVEADVEEEVAEVYPRGISSFAQSHSGIIVEVNHPPVSNPAPMPALPPAPSQEEVRSRQHQCKVCGRAFTRAFDLRRHHRTHTGERPYVCDVCGRAFTQSFPLKVHKRKHTELMNSYHCIVCRKSFSSEVDLARHMLCHETMEAHGSRSTPLSSSSGLITTIKEESKVVIVPVHNSPSEGKLVFKEIKMEEVH